MFTERDALYRLLPAYIRFRDQKAGKALQQILTIVGDQAAALQRDLERMYDGWFIETCDEWLIPYIGDLLGLEPAHLAPGEPGSERDRRLRGVLSARSATANAIAQRRRKGTLSVLEEIARDQAHWPARAVEFYRHVVVASHLDHLQPSRPATADLRSARRLTDLNGPFDDFCHVGDVHRISQSESRGQFGVPNVGLFVWRLRAYKVTRTAAYCREEAGIHCFTFSALGQNTQLLRAPTADIDRGAAQVEDLPVPLTRWTLERDALPDASRTQAEPTLYGAEASFAIEAADWPTRNAHTAITADLVLAADLSDWSYKVPKGHVAVDPVLGRIAFPASQPPRLGVKVSYRYGFAADIGGGEYSRTAGPLPLIFETIPVWPDVQPGATRIVTIADAITAWRERNPPPATPGTPVKPSAAAAPEPRQPARALVIELMTSGIYKGRFNLALEENETVAIVAAPGTRPVLWLSDESAGATDSITIRGRRGSRIILDGLLVAGRGIEIGDALIEAEGGNEPETINGNAETRSARDGLCEVWIRHSTIVPGNSLSPNCDPRSPSEPSLVVDDTSARVRIEASIVGAIRVIAERGTREPTPVSVVDSIVDATSEDRVAIGGIGGELAFAELTVRRSTIVGRVAVHAIRAAEDSIFVSRIDVARRQIGCIRFSYVSTDSRTPRRYGCEPDGALGRVDDDIMRSEKSTSQPERAALAVQWKAEARERVVPRFQSVRYGSPTYLRLTESADAHIRRGAHDQSEMGVYHDLFEPQRLAMLSDRLAEYVPASCDAAVVFVS